MLKPLQTLSRTFLCSAFTLRISAAALTKDFTVLASRKPKGTHSHQQTRLISIELTRSCNRTFCSDSRWRSSVGIVKIMGGTKSKHRPASVQGVNFAPRQETLPVYSTSSSIEGTPATVKKMSASIEAVACKVNELNDGDVREVLIGDSVILLVKEKGHYYAVGNKCTHYGAPLSKGAYCNGKVRCPWHGACFNIKNGDIEDFPGLDSLPTFEVEVRGDEIVVKADPDALKDHKRVKPMSLADSSNKQTFVLVGGGAASVACAETLRQEGFTGHILVVTKEKSLPYDRPKLSKAMNTTAGAIVLRNQEFYSKYGIEFHTGIEVTGVDTTNKHVTTSNGVTIAYEALLLATGGRPRTMPIPGQELKNVCVLRTPEDANYIAANSEGKKVVIIGSSFIGMEVTSCLAEKAKSLAVVDLIKVPFQLVLGEKVGAVLQKGKSSLSLYYLNLLVYHYDHGLEVAAYMHNKASSVSVVGNTNVALQHVFGLQIGGVLTKLHEEKGVKFYFERAIKEFRGQDGHVTQAVLSDDTVLDADICILGIGVVPSTDFLKESGVHLTQRGFITVDKYMRTNQPGVFAAGDIVEFPLFINDNHPSNVQHWQMAHQHGRIAALNMLKKNVEIHSVPFFWTVMYGKSVRYTGYGPGYDDIVVHGDLDAGQFAAFYTKGDKVVAVASLAFDPLVSQAASLMDQGQIIHKSEIIDDPRSWVGRLKQK